MVVAAQADDRMLLAEMTASPTRCSRDFRLIYFLLFTLAAMPIVVSLCGCATDKNRNHQLCQPEAILAEPFLPTTFTSS